MIYGLNFYIFITEHNNNYNIIIRFIEVIPILHHVYFASVLNSHTFLFFLNFFTFNWVCCFKIIRNLHEMCCADLSLKAVEICDRVNGDRFHFLHFSCVKWCCWVLVTKINELKFEICSYKQGADPVYTGGAMVHIRIVNYPRATIQALV